MAVKLSKSGDASAGDKEERDYIPVGDKGGKVRFIEMDAEKMDREGLGGGEFDVVWVSEALSHVPGKEAFFRSAFGVLAEGGKLVIADWFRGEAGVGDGDIKAIEGELSFFFYTSLKTIPWK